MMNPAVAAILHKKLLGDESGLRPSVHDDSTGKPI